MKQNILFLLEIIEDEFYNIRHMNNRILQMNHIINSGVNNRPPIKNNLNEQLKIYYAYRNETKRECLNNTENRPSFQ